MINKYTLIFKDQFLEAAFQKYMATEIRRPLLKKLIISSTILQVISFIEKMLDQRNGLIAQPNQLVYFGAQMLSEIFFFIIYKYKQQYLRFALFLYNHILVFIYINMGNLTVQQKLIYTIGILVIQIVNILFGEFREAVYQTITFCSIYLSLAFLNDHQIDYDLLSLMLAGMIILICAFYQNIKALRSQFQLGKIDNQWEQIFKSQINQNEYLVFYYDPNTYSFSLNQQYQNITSTKELREFLRQIKFNQITLEQEIFRKIQENQEQNNIINQKLEMFQQTQYSIFFGFKIIVLLKFNQKLDFKQQKIESMYQYKYKLFKNRIMKLVKPLNFKIRMQTHQLRKFCFYTHLKDSLTNECFQVEKNITKLNFNKIKELLQTLYKNKRIKYENISNSEFKGCKLLIMVIFIEIIEITLSQNIFIQFKKGLNDILVIKIYCDYNEKGLYILEKRIKAYSPLFFDVQFGLQDITITFKLP